MLSKPFWPVVYAYVGLSAVQCLRWDCKLLLFHFAGTMMQLFGVGESECSVIMLWTYAFASASLTLWITNFMWLLAWTHSFLSQTWPEQRPSDVQISHKQLQCTRMVILDLTVFLVVEKRRKWFALHVFCPTTNNCFSSFNTFLKMEGGKRTVHQKSDSTERQPKEERCKKSN